MGNFFTYMTLRFAVACISTLILAGSYGCDKRSYPTQSSPESAPVAKLA
ncbi:MAG: hypothetical protein ACI906_004889, partial [Candidatus Latescibacterota bacterium]